MDDNRVLDELVEMTRTLAEGHLSKEVNFKELNAKLTNSLADVVQSIESIRRGLMDVKPIVGDGAVPAPGHLGDIDKTLMDAADRLFTLTEKGMADNERAGELLRKIKVGAAGDDASRMVDELLSMNAATKAELIEAMTSLSFQDLAGQKIKKIRDLIEDAEVKLLHILVVLGYSTGGAVKADKVLSELDAASKSLDQGVVDDILKSFGL